MELSFEEHLQLAVTNGDVQQLQILLDTYGAKAIRADDHPQQLTALHWAAAAGNLEVVCFLLCERVKADPQAARINNFTPLHAAAMHGYARVCEQLLFAGANANVQTIPQGYAPLHSAAFAGHLQAIKVLVARGADLDLRNYRNERPVDTARRQSQSQTVTFLEQLI